MIYCQSEEEKRKKKNEAKYTFQTTMNTYQKAKRKEDRKEMVEESDMEEELFCVVPFGPVRTIASWNLIDLAGVCLASGN